MHRGTFLTGWVSGGPIILEHQLTFRQQQTTVNMNEVADETAMVGPVDGKFCYKKRTDGSIDKSMVVCKLCNKEFAYHRSTSSLKYHLNAKHIAASVDASVVASVDVSLTPSTRTHTQPTLHQLNGLRTRVTTGKSNVLNVLESIVLLKKNKVL